MYCSCLAGMAYARQVLETNSLAHQRRSSVIDVDVCTLIKPVQLMTLGALLKRSMGCWIRPVMGVLLLFGATSSAFASSNPGTYRLDWHVPGETLTYRSCGCADSCWNAVVRVRRTGLIKARLRCDCEVLHFSQPSKQKDEIALGSCSPTYDQEGKFNEITRELELRMGVVLPQPRSTKEVIERAESCLHFAGEFGGDRSERDEEVNREMARLDCGRAAQSLKLLKARLPMRAPERDKVEELLHAYE